MPAPEASATLDELRALQRPVFLRALLCIVFALVTVFWQPSNYWSWGDPGLTAVRWAIGIFMVLHGAVMFDAQRRLAAQAPSTSEGPALQSAALLYVLGGVLTMVAASQLTHLVLIAGLAYGLAGLTELVLGMRTSEKSAMAKDWKIGGAVTVLTAAGLFLFGEMGPKAAFGIVGGGAMVVGVFHLLAALTFRHDARVLSGQRRA